MARPLRIMPLGDSITFESGPPDGSVWRALVWTKLTTLGASFVFVGSQSTGSFPNPQNEGHGGFRIDQLTAGVPTWIPAQAPVDLVLLMAGTNDCIQEVGGAASRMGTLLATIAGLAPAATVLVSSLTPFNTASVFIGATSAGLRTAYNAALPATVAAHANAAYVDVGGTLGVADLQVDGIHPSIPDGYAKFGSAWYDALVPYILAAQPPARVALTLDSGQNVTLTARSLP